MSRLDRSSYSESEYSDIVTSPVPSDFKETSPTRRVSSDVRWGIKSPNFERSNSSESLDDRASVCSNYSRQDGEFIPTRTNVVTAKVAANAMQFVKTGPTKLVATAQEQLRKAEEVKKIKMVVKEDDNDWQSNLEGWKMSRRKRQDPVIQRVAEVKRFEQEEETRAFESKARKARTFSQMLGRTNGRKQSLGFYPAGQDDDEGGSFDFGNSGDIEEPFTPTAEAGAPNFPANHLSRELTFDEMSTNSDSVRSVTESSVIRDFRSESRDGSGNLSSVEIRVEKEFSPIRIEKSQSPRRSWEENRSSRESQSPSKSYQTTVVVNRYSETNGSREGSSERILKESTSVQMRYRSHLEENAKDKSPHEKKPNEETTANVKMRRSLFERQSSGEISSSGSDSRRKSGEISDGLRSKLQALSTAENSIVNEEARFLSQRRKSLEMSESLKNKLQSLTNESNLCQSKSTSERDEGFGEKLTSFQTVEKPNEVKKVERVLPVKLNSTVSVKSKLMSFEQKPEPEKPVLKPIPGRLNFDQKVEPEKPSLKPLPGRLNFEQKPEPEKPSKPIPGRLASEPIRSKSGSVDRDSGPLPGRLSFEQKSWKSGSAERDNFSSKPAPGRLASELIRPKSGSVDRDIEARTKNSEIWSDPVRKDQVTRPVNGVIVESELEVEKPVCFKPVQTEWGKKWNSVPPADSLKRGKKATEEVELVNQHWEPEAVLLAPAMKLAPPTGKPPPPPVEADSSSDEEEDEVMAETDGASEGHLAEAMNVSSPLRSLDTSPQSLGSSSFVNLEAHSPVGSSSDLRGLSEAQRNRDFSPPTRYVVSPMDTEFDELTRKEMEIILSLEQEEEARLKRLVKKSQGFGPASLEASGPSDDQESSGLDDSFASSVERGGVEYQQSGFGQTGHVRSGSDPFRIVPLPSVVSSESQHFTPSSEQKPSGVTSKPPVQDVRLNGGYSKDSPRRLLPKAPSVEYLDQEMANSSRPVRKENGKTDINKHWVIQEAEQRRIESQPYLSNDSLPTSDATPTILQPPMGNQSFPRSSSMGSITRQGGGSETVLSQSVSGSLTGGNFRTRGPSPNTQEAHLALSGSRSGPLRSSSTDYLSHGYWEAKTDDRLAEEPVKRAQSASHLQSDYMNLRDLQQSMVAQTRGSYADSSKSSNRSSQLSGSGPAPQAPALPPRTSSSEKASRERMLSVSGKKKCSQCSQELGRGAAMIIETLRLYYHMDCFRCCVCQSPLGSGLAGTDVRVRNAMLHCRNCYSNDDGFKFSKV